MITFDTSEGFAITDKLANAYVTFIPKGFPAIGKSGIAIVSSG